MSSDSASSATPANAPAPPSSLASSASANRATTFESDSSSIQVRAPPATDTSVSSQDLPDSKMDLLMTVGWLAILFVCSTATPKSLAAALLTYRRLRDAGWSVWWLKDPTRPEVDLIKAFLTNHSSVTPCKIQRLYVGLFGHGEELLENNEMVPYMYFGRNVSGAIRFPVSIKEILSCCAGYHNVMLVWTGCCGTRYAKHPNRANLRQAGVTTFIIDEDCYNGGEVEAASSHFLAFFLAGLKFNLALSFSADLIVGKQRREKYYLIDGECVPAANLPPLGAVEILTPPDQPWPILMFAPFCLTLVYEPMFKSGDLDFRVHHYLCGCLWQKRTEDPIYYCPTSLERIQDMPLPKSLNPRMEIMSCCEQAVLKLLRKHTQCERTDRLTPLSSSK